MGAYIARPRCRLEERFARIKQALDEMVENVLLTEGKKEGTDDGAVEHHSVFTSTVDEALTYREVLEGKIRHTECPLNALIFSRPIFSRP